MQAPITPADAEARTNERQPAQTNLTPAANPRRLVFAATVLLSAFLLIQVELIISKYLLPWFGGTAALWTTAMLLFQVLLFAGYAYAHLITDRLLPRTQFRLHLTLLLTSLVILGLAGMRWPSPITPGASWRPASPDHPILDVTAVLVASVAAPFFLLSTSGPLLQSWYSQISLRSPYRLYAVSNAGSLLGLISYPLVIEPFLRLRTQAWTWAGLYALFGVGACICAASIRSLRVQPAFSESIPAAVSKPTLSLRILWIALSACGSVSLLATTNLMSQYVAAVPLIWVVPLALYLLSFIICFGHSAWYNRALFHPLYLLSGLLALLAIASTQVWPMLLSAALLVFSICMVCHGEVARLKPGPRWVTSFYLSLAAGGALGGILVGIVAPAILSRLWEFEISILAAGVLLLLVLIREKNSWLHVAPVWIALPVILALILIPLAAQKLSPDVAHELDHLQYFQAAIVLCVPAVLVLLVVTMRPADRKSLRPLVVMSVVVLLAFAWSFPRLSWGFGGRAVARSRSFYGVLEVQQYPDQFMLLHGKTVHGAQFIAPMYRSLPSTYYTASSGVGRFFRDHPKRNPISPMRVGVIGLGIGTLAAYGLPGDYYRFYELDPDVLDAVGSHSRWFTYLQGSKANVDVVLGDGRLSLEREATSNQLQDFDVFVLDAFNGDAIPVHLLTREAFEVYLKHLKPDGVLVAHISTSALNLAPVLLGNMQALGLHGTVVRMTDATTGVSSVWVFLARNSAALATPGLRQHGAPLSFENRPVFWSDDYSNIIGLVGR